MRFLAIVDRQKRGVGSVDRRLVTCRRHGTRHQLAHTVADKGAHLVQAALWQTDGAQGGVAAVRQILEGVQQGPVEIKDAGFYAHHKPSNFIIHVPIIA